MRRAALLLLALLALPSLVQADHVYSHRYVVDGRLLGSDGLPLPGREVTISVQGDDFLERCREGSEPVTDERGDFRFCYHIHALQAGSYVNVTYGNATAMRSVDVAFRRTHVLLRETNETGIAPPNWSETYRISGRAWRPGPIELEGVQVFGEAVIGLPVNLTVHGQNATPAVFTTRTDGYGDFDLELTVLPDAKPEEITMTLEAMGRGQPVALESFFHRSYSPIYVALTDAPDVPDRPIDVSPQTDPSAPGSGTPRVSPVLVVAMALALVAAVVLSRRKGA